MTHSKTSHEFCKLKSYGKRTRISTKNVHFIIDRQINKRTLRIMLDVQLHHWHAPSKLELKHHSCVILVQNRHYYNSIPFILFHSALPVAIDWHRCLGINVKGTTNQINNVSVETIANTESSWAGEQQEYQADVKA